MFDKRNIGIYNSRKKMVVSPIGIYPLDSFIISVIRRFCGGSIHIFSVLMKKVYKYITKVARPINKGIVWIALLLTYLVICLYHFCFIKKHRDGYIMKRKFHLNKQNIYGNQ